MGPATYICDAMASNKTKDYYEEFRKELRDETRAAAYLEAALEGGDPQVFLLALRNVALAQGGINAK